MRKSLLVCAALAVGAFTASCAGNGTSPVLPTSFAPAAPQHVPPGWAATATRAVPLKNFPTGIVPATTRMHVVVGLYMRDHDGAQKLLRSQHTRGASEFMHWMTPAEFTARFNPTASQARSVADYLKREGFTEVKIEPNRLIVSGYAPVSRVEAAFNTSIRGAMVNGKQIYGNVKPALVPEKLGKLVAAVLGLTNAYHMQVQIKKSDRSPLTMAMGAHQGSPLAMPTEPPCTAVATTFCVGGFYGPQQYQIAYDAPQCAADPKDVRHATRITAAWADCSGIKTSIAVISAGNVSSVVGDLRTAEKYWGLPKVPFSVKKVGVSNPVVSGLDEWDLDTQISSGFAEGVKHLYLYDATTLDDSDIALAYSHWVTDDLAQGGNSSFAESETLAYADGAMTIDDEEFNQAASQGQTMFASTGDNGGGCSVVVATGVPDTGTPEVCYPATSPYAVAVGGTTLDTNAVGPPGPCTVCDYPGTYYGEHAWVGTGGGFSKWESPPYWQYNGICAGCAELRGIADIAMCADNNGCPMWVYTGGTWEGVGGTSLSSPMSMGLWARLETHFNNALGFAAPVYYGVYGYYEPCPLSSTACVPAGEPGDDTAAAPPDTTAPIGGFHDILDGTNGLGGVEGSALPGWDVPTGLGSIDYLVMQSDISNSIFSGH